MMTLKYQQSKKIQVINNKKYKLKKYLVNFIMTMYKKRMFIRLKSIDKIFVNCIILCKIVAIS